jgi:DNA topoisomerase-1
MQIAQQLYEGVTIKGIGSRGLITYIRTDSVRISDAARAAASEYIGSTYGDQYKGNNVFANKNKAMQDAHEAIRPSDVTIDPESVREALAPEQFRLYELIWKRFVASQMAAAEYDTVSVRIQNGKYEFKASGSRMTFDGWKKVYKTSSDDNEVNIPALTEGQILALRELITEQKFTQPPARYTEASLVKEMEEKNIGRPSTYAAIISVLINRKYVKRVKKTLEPTKLGFDVTGILEEYFSDIVDVDFTGEMEDNLDSVELGEKEWKSVISDFYKGFSEELKVADREANRIEKEVILTDETCELCGKPMAIKEGRFGQFLACSGYPECSVMYWDKPVGRMCPECGSMLVESKGKTASVKCSNPECKYREKRTDI